MQFSNPRKQATFENWPSGSKRVTCTFLVESNKKGERIARTTTGKPKLTTYHDRMCIVDGDDGKTYLIGESKSYKMVSVLSSDMQHSEGSHFESSNDPQYEVLKALLDSAA